MDRENLENMVEKWWKNGGKPCWDMVDFLLEKA